MKPKLIDLQSPARFRHAHRPWRLSRWVECGDGAVVWELYAAACSHCPDCHGAGGWWVGAGPYGEDPEMVECGCTWPLVTVRVPVWLDKMTPRSPTRTRTTDPTGEPPPF